MPKYNGYKLPDLPESEYKNAYISVSGENAYLYFVDKKGYIQVDGTGNLYTLGLTTSDEYDESKILFAEHYISTIGGNEWTPAELPDWSGIYDIPPHAQFALPCEIGGPVWSNVTLLDQDGNVFIEGNVPQKEFDSLSWLTGYILGITGKPYPFAKKKLVGYSYNGVVLPALPEIPEKLEYAVMFYSASQNKTWVRFSKGPFIYGRKSGSNGTNYVSTYTDTYFESSIDHSAGETAWGEIIRGKGYSYNDYYVSTGTSMTLIWANHDITYDQYSDENLVGKVALTGSDPIPVYE